jgi:hypothetical protein
MHQYMTRHMVALREFVYADASIRAGDSFLATPDDARYLTRAGKARDGVSDQAEGAVLKVESFEPLHVSVDAAEVGSSDAEFLGAFQRSRLSSPEAEVESPAQAEELDTTVLTDPIPRRRGRPRKAA